MTIPLLCVRWSPGWGPSETFDLVDLRTGRLLERLSTLPDGDPEMGLTFAVDGGLLIAHHDAHVGFVQFGTSVVWMDDPSFSHRHRWSVLRGASMLHIRDSEIELRLVEPLPRSTVVSGLLSAAGDELYVDGLSGLRSLASGIDARGDFAHLGGWVTITPPRGR